MGIFSDTINNLKSIITGGKELTPIQAQAVAGTGNSGKNLPNNAQTGTRNTSKNDNAGGSGVTEFKGNININITVNGDKVSGNNKDVAVRSDKDKLNIGIPKNIWEAFQPEVKPTGR